MGQDNEAASLPDDLLADILGRLAPRWLAMSRRVCKAWQATIDAHRLLLRYYGQLPLRFEGIFLNFTNHKFPEFFSRSQWPPVTGEMNFLPCANEHMEDDLSEIQDHCNGLLLLQDEGDIPKYVVNPATRRWDSLPKCPASSRRVMGVDCCSDAYLVYDPMVSPHYQVFMIPSLPYKRDDGHIDHLLEQSEWPLAACTIHVFSSRTHCWEPRYFDREGDALGTIAEMQAREELPTWYWWWMRRRAVYRRETLYVHCKGKLLMSISLSNGMFRAIELPDQDTISNKYKVTYLGRSEKGVYFASLHESGLRVWILDESCGKIQWTLKHEHVLMLPRHEFGRPLVRGPWVLQDTNYNFFHMPGIYKNEEAVLLDDEAEFEWSSDDEDCNDAVANGGGMAETECGAGDVVILGFHPFKEIIFLLLGWSSIKIPLAYHYNSLKAQVLGNVEPTGYNEYFILPNDGRTIEGFPYVPCWLEEFPTNTTQSSRRLS